MPQENGWATGPEYCDQDGRVCPYCGSENTDSGSLDTQAGQVVESDCECLDCGKTFGNLYNIAGWYDADENLHEDLRDFNNREHVRILQEALLSTREMIWNKDIPSPTTPEYREWHENCQKFMKHIDAALEATKEGS